MRTPILMLVLLLIFRTPVSAQSAVGVTRDTSFNIPATLIKERKKRPYITVAAPVPSGKVVVKKDLAYRSIGPRDLLLDVYYPRKTKVRKPAVLLVFGGGWRSGDKSHNQAMAIELANNDFVAVSAEYRLSPEAIYPAAVIDLKSAIQWMRIHAAEYGIDTNNVAVMGCSAGGQLAALMGTTNSDTRFEENSARRAVNSNVQAVIDIDGTLAFHHPESVEGKVAAEWLGGTYEEHPDLWKEAAPLEHIDQNTVPFLFINSSIPRFHAGRDDMIRKMDRLNIYSEIHTLEDTPHPFWFFHPWFDPMMNYIIGFLNKRFKH